MTDITLHLNAIQNRIADLYKSKYNHKSKESAIIDMIEKIGEEFNTEDLTRDWKEDPVTEKQLWMLKKIGIKNIKKNMTKFEAYKIIEEHTIKDQEKNKKEEAVYY